MNNSIQGKLESDNIFDIFLDNPSNCVKFLYLYFDIFLQISKIKSIP